MVEAAKSAKHYVLTLGMVLRRKLKADPCDSDLQADNYIVSPWFGIFAYSSIGLYLIMGVLIPLRLSEGTFGAPLVRSRVTEKCLNSNALDHIPDIIEQQPKTGAVFQECLD